MKANELRIGNLIQNIEGDVYCIDRIYSKDFYHGYYLNNGRYIRQGKEFMKPITLTEERLLHLGFKRINVNISVFRYKNFDLCLSRKKFTLLHYRKPITLEYVHRLQNIYFELENEELTKQPSSSTP